MDGKYKRQGTSPLLESVRVRVTQSDRAHIERQAQAACLTVSEYIRRCATGRVIVSRADDVMIRELRRIGGLLKHVHVESDGAYSAATASAVESVRAAIDAITYSASQRVAR